MRVFLDVDDVLESGPYGPRARAGERGFEAPTRGEGDRLSATVALTRLFVAWTVADLVAAASRAPEHAFGLGLVICVSYVRVSRVSVHE